MLLDLLITGMDGYELLDEIQDRVEDGVYLPILVLTSDHSHDAERRALSGGASDFLTKPLSPSEVRLRVSLLQTRMLQKKLRHQNLLLEDQKLLLEHRVRARTQDLEAARLEILQRLARAAEIALTIVRELTEAHGGHVELAPSPEEGGGAVFDLYLPVEPVEEEGGPGRWQPASGDPDSGLVEESDSRSLEDAEDAGAPTAD